MSHHGTLSHADEHQKCLLIGVDQKGPTGGQSDAVDPLRTLDIKVGPLNVTRFQPFTSRRKDKLC
jgi:hypothetical protein